MCNVYVSITCTTDRAPFRNQVASTIQLNTENDEITRILEHSFLTFKLYPIVSVIFNKYCELIIKVFMTGMGYMDHFTFYVKRNKFTGVELLQITE